MTRQPHDDSMTWAAAAGIVADASRPMTRQPHDDSMTWAAAAGIVATGDDR